MSPPSRSFHRLPFLVWSVAVAALMLTPGSNLPEIAPFDWSDKLGHALAFGLECALLYRWLEAAARPGRALPGALLGSGLYAILLEALQILVPERRWDWWDLVADGVGIAVAAALLAGRSRARLRRTP